VPDPPIRLAGGGTALHLDLFARAFGGEPQDIRENPRRGRIILPPCLSWDCSGHGNCGRSPDERPWRIFQSSRGHSEVLCPRARGPELVVCVAWMAKGSL